MRKTRAVMVGNVGVGGDNPVRIQSMTISKTTDIDATIEQIIKLADAGCEIARVTVQGKKEAAACEAIKSGLIQRGYTIPLVADIHFYPPAAMDVADFVDKVRINPGNFVDRRATFRILQYTEESYQKELEKIEEVFGPFVDKCKRLGKPIRIGVNHGSLSDRIMNRFGDTPRGMVESALEFTRVARARDFHDIIYSMKASNPLVMLEVYRLLDAELAALGWDYPLHLGVTEAGDGEDGRIKSAIGIGTLLMEGIGDTIRCSLTEDPWHEIEPCRQLIDFANSWQGTVPRTTEPLPKGFVYPEEKEEGSKLVEVKGENLMAIAAEAGALLTGGAGDLLSICGPWDAEKRREISYAILQGCRMRRTKTEYIACPGCGRTLFNIQEVTQKIRARTAHLPGVNIAIMGCIVNGPGEMADADFGYVGSKTGKVDLYVKKTCVERGIDEEVAVDRLIDLLKEHGVWVPPPIEAASR